MNWNQFWTEQKDPTKNDLHKSIWHLRRYLAEKYSSFFISNLHQEPRKILEVGCGSGSTLGLLKKRFPNASCVGIDRSASALSLAKESNPGCIFVQGDAFDLSGFNGFDLVYSVGLIEHFDRELALDIMRQKALTLKKGGALGLVVPMKNSPIDFCRKAAGDSWPYGYEDPFSPSEVHTIVKKCGFGDLKETCHLFSIYQCISF